MIQHERWHDEKYDYYTIGLNTNFSHPLLHWHRCFEISLVLEGEIMMQYEDQNYILTAGDMIFVTSNCLHVHKTMTSSKIFCCLFSPELVPAVSSELMKYKLTSPILHQVPDICRELFETINKNFISANFSSERKENIAAVKGALYMLCSFFVDNLDLTSENTDLNRGNELLNKMFLYVENNMDKPCTLSDVAFELGYKPAYLSRVFSQSVGVSFHDYVKNIKIGHSCFLLDTTQERIVNIAIQCGFSSLASFNRSFRQVVGQSPTSYRNQKNNRRE